MSEQDQVQLFDRWAAHYDEQVQAATDVFRGYGEVLDQVVRAAQAGPGMRVLELGIGTGNLAQRFLALGCEVWGLDFSSAMLAVARAKVPQARITQVDLMAQPWPGELDRRFDRIVSTYVLHAFDLPTKVRLLGRLARDHLEVGGRIVVGDIAFPSMRALREAGADHWDEDEFYWAADETIAACRRARLHASYEQVSICGGVFAIEPTPAGR